jgi:hypothetical protein
MFTFSFLDSVTVNFLSNDNRKYYSIAVCSYNIAIAITTSRKHVGESRRFCLFVCIAELIGPELWMVEDGVALNGVWKDGWCKVG